MFRKQKSVFDPEIGIAKKYILGEILDPEDEPLVERMECVGLMHTGLHIDVNESDEKIGLARTAGTTHFAVGLFNLGLYKKKMELIRRFKIK